MSDVNFKCTVIRERFSSDDFKIYVVSVDKSIYKNVKCNKQGDYVISGNMQSLIPNLSYEVVANVSVHKTYGVQYDVKNIKTDKPTDIESSKHFLYEVITKNQAESLLEVYPNIIDMIVKNDLSKLDLNKVKGIKETTFNVIKRKIIENFALVEVVDLFKGTISMSMVKKLYDKYSSVSKIKSEIQKDPYKSLCNISRVGFKTADSAILSIEKLGEFKFEESNLITSKQRMRACLEYILTENESCGNTKIDIVELRKMCHTLTSECIEHFVGVIKEENSNIHVENSKRCVSTSKAYDTECYIADTINIMLKNNIQWDIHTEWYRQGEEGLDLTDEQMVSLDNICKYNVSILTAPAGSGKSASVKNVITMLDENKKSYMLCTPTGKSSKVLSEYTGKDSGTIHRKLEYNPSREGNPWGFNESNKLDVDVVIVDEFGMVDIYLMKHLLEAIDVNRTKLLLVFDSYQLSSVGCGNVAHDVLSSNVVPVARLTKIFRYNEGGLMNVVTKIRNSENFLEDGFTGVEIFGSKKDFVYNEVQQTKIANQVINIYKKILNDGYSIQDIMVLTSQNKGEYGTKEVNKKIQFIMQKGKSNRFIMRGEDKFFVGDKVLQIENNYKATTPHGEETDIFNGNTGIIIDATWNDITVDFGDKLILYNKADLSQLELGYCTTIHKSQGDNAKQVIVISPKAHTFMLNSNLLYVGCTRARERVYLLGNIITINRAIKKKENLTRNTHLKELLSNS